MGPWCIARSNCARPNINDPANVTWNAITMFAEPEPRNTNTTAKAVANHGPTLARSMIERNSVAVTRCTTTSTDR